MAIYCKGGTGGLGGGGPDEPIATGRLTIGSASCIEKEGGLGTGAAKEEEIDESWGCVCRRCGDNARGKGGGWGVGAVATGMGCGVVGREEGAEEERVR